MAYKTAAIRDHDGSFGGGPESYVLINDGPNDSIAVDAGACEIKPTWNAAVCKGDVGRMNIGAGGGGGRGLAWRRALPEVAVDPAVLSQPPVLALAAVLVALVVAAALLAHAALPGSWWRWRQRRSRRRWWTCSAASRSQPQWQGLHRNERHRTSWYRNQGDHRKADRVPLPDGNGERLVGDL